MAKNLIEDIKDELRTASIIKYFGIKNINKQLEFLKDNSKDNTQDILNTSYQLIAYTERFFELVKKQSIEIEEAKIIFKKMVECASIFAKLELSSMVDVGLVFERKYKHRLLNCISIFQFFTLDINHITENISFPDTLNSIPLTFLTSLTESHNANIITSVLIGKMKHGSSSMEDIFVAILSQYFTIKPKNRVYVKRVHDSFKFAILNAREIFYDTECEIILSFLEYFFKNPKIAKYLASKEFDHKFDDYQFSPTMQLPKLENAATLQSHKLSTHNKKSEEKASKTKAIDNIVSITGNVEIDKKFGKADQQKVKNKNLAVNAAFIKKRVEGIERKIKFAFMISDIDIMAEPIEKLFSIIDMPEKKEATATMREKYDTIARIVRRIISFDGPVAQKAALEMNLEEEIGNKEDHGYIRDSAEILEEFIEKRFSALDRYVRNLMVSS